MPGLNAACLEVTGSGIWAPTRQLLGPAAIIVHASERPFCWNTFGWTVRPRAVVTCLSGQDSLGGAQVPYWCSYARIPPHNVMPVTSSMVPVVHHVTSVTPSSDTAIFKGQQRTFAGQEETQRASIACLTSKPRDQMYGAAMV